MNRIHKVMIRAAIGAAIGGSVASFLAIIVVREPRFFADALQFFGTGGLIGGAILGAMIGAFSENGRKVGGIIGGVGGCILMMIAACLYASIPWPSPQPYPGVQTSIHWDGGSWGPSRVQTYTVTLSLDDMQQYYEEQMNRYCVSSSQFETLPDHEEYSLCREAGCEIRRLWLEQYFRVHLCSVPETGTVVTQMDMWQD